MYRYAHLKETSWRVWEVGGTVVLIAVKAICGVEPSDSTVGYFFWGKMNNPHNLFICGVLQVGFECAKQICYDIFRNVYNFVVASASRLPAGNIVGALYHKL